VSDWRSAPPPKLKNPREFGEAINELSVLAGRTDRAWDLITQVIVYAEENAPPKGVPSE
jgi:hypothetical protein